MSDRMAALALGGPRYATIRELEQGELSERSGC